ncbi:ser/thr protein phosphatase family [Rhodotorula toruloides]|uniref:Ser/thr protein phosphatase family n=1 Tax=Rhodotorula toruloides TaxID=5286 RepID=A0A511KLG5_RHOTO|nr:ser/thr protein phosphatase family [Rhodotorula toruloides]
MSSAPGSSRLHRRTSSAALHTSYTPLVGGPGDIASSLDPAYSSATAPHSRSVSLGYADADEDEKEKDDDGEEKDGLIPRYTASSARLGSGAGGWRAVPSRSRRARGGAWWKCKVFLVFLIATAVGGLVWYWFFAPPSTRETVNEVKGWWEALRSAGTSASARGSAASSAAPQETGVGWSRLKVDEIKWTATTPSASHSVARPTTTKSRHAAAARPMPTSASTLSRFAHVEQAIKNGSLGAYKWHAVLPPVEDGGRVIVVGDVHGTHRSLVSLLSHLRFSPSSPNVLIHTGDLPHKSSLSSSLTTISLLRRLGAKGVRGNTDQRVVEWRRWMESVGPLDLEEKAGANRVPDGAGFKYDQKPSFGQLKRPSRPLTVDEDEEAEKRGVPQPRVREKRAGGARSWLGWLTGGDEVEFESAHEEDKLGLYEDEVKSVSSKTSVVQEATGHRRPFGRPTTTLASSASTSTPTRFSAASRLSASASSSSSSDGSLLGPLYSHLSPSFPSSRLRALNLPLPPPSSGLTWGSPEFELARHLPAEDFAYLGDLPLTLWVEELESWVVHAGMVARANSSIDGGGKGRDAHGFPPNAMLDSSNPRAFSPSSSRISRLLRSSSKWSLLLEEPNTDPWTLMNLRTLEPSEKETNGWKVSAKGGRKASKGSRVWWKVWEDEMRGCAKRAEGEADEEEGGCEKAGIVYGHWAGQGLQVHEHSIGLDTGCVYGRRLSALVVPLSNSSRTSASTSTSSFSASATITSRISNPKAKGKANWHGGMQKVTASAPAASGGSLVFTRSSAAKSTSTAGAKATSASYDGYAEDELDYPSSTSPSASSSPSSPSSDSEDSQKPWWRPWKRAPPQGRPGVAPWEGMEELQVDFGAEADEEVDDEERLGGMTEVWKGGKKARPTAYRTASSSVAPTPTLTMPSLSTLLVDAGADLDSTAFHERRVTLHNGRIGQIISVDCAGEVEVD